MTWKSLKANKYWKFFANKYAIIVAIFIIWILFIDVNSWMGSHRKLDQQIAEKEEAKAFYEKGVARDKARIKQLQDSAGLEKYARERYLMKKEGEEIYIIEHPDSIKKD